MSKCPLDVASWRSLVSLVSGTSLDSEEARFCRRLKSE